MKHVYCILLSVLALSMASCVKEQASAPSTSDTVVSGMREFTADIISSKVSFEEGKLAWEMDDLVTISDGTVKSLFKVSEIKDGVATFSLVEGETELASNALRYTAVYPASMFDSLHQISVGAAGEETSCFPMGAVSTNAKLSFTNLCSLVRLMLSTDSGNAALKSVSIVADKPLTGPFSIVDGGAVMSGSAPVAAMTSCSAEGGFPLGTDPLVLYVAVPAGEYSTFDVEAVTSTGVKKVFPLKGNSVSLRRSAIYTKEVVLEDLDVNDFREEGPANCYMALHAGKYRFAATLNDGSDISGVSGARLVWTYDNTKDGPSPGSIITNVSYADGVIDFTTDGTPGNALIAAVDASDNILWSWHIWCPSDAPSDLTYPGGVMMDRYLGAQTARKGDLKSIGFMYQNGRKDPFPGRVAAGNIVGAFCGTAYSETAGPVDIEKTVKNPNVRYYGSGSNFWSTAECRDKATWDGDTKTIYDPCPYGYRVPSNTILGTTAKADIQKLFAWDSANVGFSFQDGLAWYPATGQLAPQGPNINSGTAISFSWARNSVPSSGNPYMLDLRQAGINGWGGGAAAAGFAVRCERSSK